MASYYSVIRFVPDTVAGECVNLGVIVVDQDGCECRLLRNWGRAARFAGVAAQDLKDVAQQFDDATGLFFRDDNQLPKLTLAKLEEMAVSWKNSVQITPPRGSLRPRGELLDQMARLFLKDSRPAPQQPRKKSTAVALGKEALRRAVEQEQLADQYKIVDRQDAAVRGERVVHHFDYGLKNGEVKLAGFGLSFDLTDEEDINRQVDLIALAAIDVRERGHLLPISVVMVGDVERRQEAVRRADQLLGPSHVALLREEQVEEWTAEHVHDIVGVN